MKHPASTLVGRTVIKAKSFLFEMPPAGVVRLSISFVKEITGIHQC
jgi:hypothetical protein